MVANHVARAAKRAALGTSGVHRLHSFCSHLAMRGAPARAIQKLAGHQDLITTQRYMHLSPAAIEGAIRLLDRRPGPPEGGRYARSESARSDAGRGDILETADV
jgi:integrase